MDDQVEECPVCTEEMDLTDRHLKPCPCGYQVCVWCWHHIMETSNRCPACRQPYDKDRIVASRLNCDELLSDKKKSHKTKSKSQEGGRRHLNTVRVMQRNLVYVVGFPSHLADEETLERREFFGQYGKILKVAISRNPPNSPTSSVYVTYVREEDANKCIDAVHGFVLQGKALRATHGTNKYCHSWLKYNNCGNIDCLYLHEEGLEEDKYTKEQMLKDHHFHDPSKPPRQAGFGLPPLSTEATTSSSRAPTAKIVASSKSTFPGLPAAASWGTRANTEKPVATKPPIPGPVKKKATPGATRSVCKDDAEDTPGTSTSHFADGVEDSTERSSHESSSPEDVRAFSGSNFRHWGEPQKEEAESAWRDNPEPPPRSPNEDPPVLLNVGDVSISLTTTSGSEPVTESIPGSEFERRAPDMLPSSPDVVGPAEDVISALDRIVLDGVESFPDLGISSSSSTGAGKGLDNNIVERQVNGNKQAECSIIDDILSMDISTDGPGDLTDLLSGRTPGSNEVSRKKQQSRFSFARQENVTSTTYASPRPSRVSKPDDQRPAFSSFNSSLDETLHDYRDRHASMHSPVSEFPGQSSASKPRLFAPPGFSGTPPPGFSRNIASRPLSPAGRVSDYDLMDPGMMELMQNEQQLSTRLRTQANNNNKHDVRLFPPSEVLGLISHHSPGLREIDVIFKQQAQQERLLNERRAAAAFKYDAMAAYADGGRIPGQYEDIPYSPGAAVNRGYRSVSPHDGSWLGGAGGYGAEVYSPEMKFKSSLRAGHHGVGLGVSNSLRQAADAKNMLFANGNPALEHYLNDPSFREADVQGAYV